MHQALYRKWRPQTFDDVCGQEHITSILKYEAQRGAFNHAYLFCGSRGTGKTTCAKILAKVVNCENPANGNPCGVCPACRSIDSGTATDVLEMDAASNNGVDDIRDIRDEVVYAPSALKYRVYIVDEVHMLSNSAFNALLKTLEEPPAHVIFILATTELQKLPATIISRCQRFDFRRISVDVLTQRLLTIAEHENIKIDRDAARLISKLAEGGMRDAISLLELCSGSHKEITVADVNETVGSAGREKLVGLMYAIKNKNFDVIFAEVAEVVESSKDISVFWQDLISLYRDILVVKTSKSSVKYLDLTEAEYEELKALADLFSKETLIYHCKMLDDALYSMQRSNFVKRMIAELTLVRMCDESLDASNEALLSRISKLEDSLSGCSFTLSNGNAPIKSDAKQTASESVPDAVTSIGKKADENEKGKTTDSTKNIAPKAHNINQENNSSTGGTKALRCWMEVVDKVSRSDVTVSSFVKQTKGFEKGDGSISVVAKSSFVLMMLEKGNGRDLIRAALSSCLGREVRDSALIFEVADIKTDDGGDKLDELIEN